MAGDLLATVKPRLITDIQIGDKLYQIPALPAVVWLDILADEQPDLLGVLPGLVDDPDCGDHLTELMLDGSWTAEDYEETVLAVVAVASGRYWWTAFRLLGAAKDPLIGDWLRGNLVLHHIDAEKLSLAAWLDALYAIMTKNMDPDRCAKFDAQLNQPPADGKAKMTRAHKRANFAAAMNA